MSTETVNGNIKPRDLRRALGTFATGVAVVTTRAPDGRPVGLTVNSFSSVSLSPPLVLWSLSRHSPSLAAFEQAPYYAVNVLAADQTEISTRFATPVPDKFDDLDWHTGLGDVPLLRGCVASFECRNRLRHEGGDHRIFMGEVERFDHSDREPLVFLAGRYHCASAHQMA